MSTRGDRLITALRADTDLLFEVMAALKGEKVAGPWVPTPGSQYKRTRRGLDGKLLAVVTKHATRRFNPWEAAIVKDRDGERPTLNHTQQGQALDWCDMRLIEQGYTLAGGE